GDFFEAFKCNVQFLDCYCTSPNLFSSLKKKNSNNNNSNSFYVTPLPLQNKLRLQLFCPLHPHIFRYCF
ncbi:hypothetical protein X975_03238, partial [Stegodyphus mimosarum]